MVKTMMLNALIGSAVRPNFDMMGGLEAKFNAFNVWQNKSYTSKDEMAARFADFSENDRLIQESNSQNKSYSLGHNKFSDMSWDDFKATYVGNYLHNPTLNRKRNFDYSLTKRVAGGEDAIDWVAKGGVTAVKDQGQCGSCWAFSSTGGLEGALFASSGKLTSLSEQQLVSCDHNGDQGCNGGLMDHAFDWVADNGICAEADYTYTSGGGSSGSCKKGCASAATATGHRDVPEGDEDAMYTALQSSTISVAIEADRTAFQFYSGGVLDNSACGTSLDHGVMVVGYGTDSGKEYWNVKNSWGGSWGEHGYIRMVKGKNQCGISLSASQPQGVKPAAPTPPTPSPPPTPRGEAHYGDPRNGCLSDEQAIRVQGLPGDFCSPSCTSSSCPTDMPAGVSADPECVLQDSSGGSSCALICAPSVEWLKANQEAANGQCGDATCQPIQGLGICTYD